jgi:hypothetical protein
VPVPGPGSATPVISVGPEHGRCSQGGPSPYSGRVTRVVDGMDVYRIIDRLRADPDSNDRWFIERAMPRGTPPMRILFNGTREQAQAEVDRLNAFISAKIQLHPAPVPSGRG